MAAVGFCVVKVVTSVFKDAEDTYSSAALLAMKKTNAFTESTVIPAYMINSAALTIRQEDAFVYR